jgi:hypothetical protein
MVTDADDLGVLFDYDDLPKRVKSNQYFCSLEEVALALQADEKTAKPLSRERVRQIERTALLKVRRRFIELGIAGDMLDALAPEPEPHDCPIEPPLNDPTSQASYRWNLTRQRRKKAG